MSTTVDQPFGGERAISTTVDQRFRKRRTDRSSAADTREHVLIVASIGFSQMGFDHLGVREIASDADVDPATLIRVFGSKEALFADVAAGAFRFEAPFKGSIRGLGRRIATHLTGGNAEPALDEFDGLCFLMRSATSSIAAPILAAALHKGLVKPMAEQLGGEDAQMRAALLAACVLGFMTARFALCSTGIVGSLDKSPACRDRLRTRLGKALQACVT